MERITTIVCAGLALLLVGCKDLGLEGNIPAEESRAMPPPDLVAAVWAPAEQPDPGMIVDGRLWVPTGSPRILPADALTPVGSTAGRTIYARAWDERPYRALFTAVPAPDPGTARTAREAMDAGREHWQEYAPVIGRTGAP